jgi:1,5-anhydro-D-fructose reductase (1,5-anhydro-D-mannitol-forming)
MSIGWAVIGTGRVNRSMVQAMKAAKDTRVVAVLSRDQSRAEAFAGAHGIERAYASLDALVRDPQVDAVYVASPNALHAAQTISAAEAGKHVLCEKPMAPTLAECHRMIEACRRGGVRLGIGFQYRQYPAKQKARAIVAEGGLGRVLFADIKVEIVGRNIPGWYTEPGLAGGGITYLAGVHRIDLLRFILGAEVEEVSAFLGTQTPGCPYEEALVGILRFANGAHATLHFGLNIPHGTNRVEVHGSSGSLFGDTNSPWWGEYSPELLVKSNGVTARYQFPKTDAYLDEIEDFNRCIREGGQPLATGLDGLRAAEISLALFESGRQGKAVRISPS